MTTVLNEQIESGDVIELELKGEPTTALVLLASEQALILDPCDGTEPYVVRRDELIDYRKFVPAD